MPHSGGAGPRAMPPSAVSTHIRKYLGKFEKQFENILEHEIGA
jgi:hypothetical protein